MSLQLYKNNKSKFTVFLVIISIHDIPIPVFQNRKYRQQYYKLPITYNLGIYKRSLNTAVLKSSSKSNIGIYIYARHNQIFKNIFALLDLSINIFETFKLQNIG